MLTTWLLIWAMFWAVFICGYLVAAWITSYKHPDDEEDWPSDSTEEGYWERTWKSENPRTRRPEGRAAREERSS